MIIFLERLMYIFNSVQLGLSHTDEPFRFRTGHTDMLNTF